MRTLSKKCAHCGGSFTGDYAHGKEHWRKRKYCSVECKKDAQTGVRRAPVLTKACEYCGRQFRNRRASGRAIEPSEWATARFCSPKCRHASLRGKPAWNKGLKEDVKERFLRHVEKRDDGCWEWTAQRNRAGYGQFSIDGFKVIAHRASYRLFKGEIPEGPGFHGTCVCHTCDHPWCVNPDHLFLGTHYTNMQDKKSKGRQNHLKGNGHPMSRLSERDVQTIRYMYASGLYTQREIGSRFGVSGGNVSLIVNHRAWT